MNLWLDQALTGCDMSDTGVTDTASFVREDYTSHGLHLNSRGKRKIINLTAERIGGSLVINVSSIPVIIHNKASPFSPQNQKHKGA
jgi:hypothetical protein